MLKVHICIKIVELKSNKFEYQKFFPTIQRFAHQDEFYGSWRKIGKKDFDLMARRNLKSAQIGNAKNKISFMT